MASVLPSLKLSSAHLLSPSACTLRTNAAPLPTNGKGTATAITCRMSCLTNTVSDHASFIKDVACMEAPPNLQLMFDVLQERGKEIIEPDKKNGIIPLAIPLAKDATTGSVTALLRWPTPPDGMEMPIVEVQKHGVVLLAKTVDEYIHRILVEEDTSEDLNGNIFTTCEKYGFSLYKKGDFANSKTTNVQAYLMKKVGLFPDVFEKLALGHLERGDQVSALVTGEYYASKKHFPGFARPFVFNAELMLKVGRQAEAKDAAKVALKSPWWTLGCKYEEVAKIAGWGDEQIEYMQEKVTEEGRQEELTKGKAPAQVALDEAAFLLDLAAVDGNWDEIRNQLARCYREAGLAHLFSFVLY